MRERKAARPKCGPALRRLCGFAKNSLSPRCSGQRGRLAWMISRLRLNFLGESGDCGFLEEVRERQTHSESLFDLRDHLHGHQGMSAKVEEIVVNSDALQFHQLGPDFGNRLFGFRV